MNLYFINAFYDQFCEIPMKLWHCAKVAFACAAIDALCGFCPCPCGPRCRDCVYVNVIDSAADHLSDFNITARWIPMRKNNVKYSGDAVGFAGGGDRAGVSCPYICKMPPHHCNCCVSAYSWGGMNHKVGTPQLNAGWPIFWTHYSMLYMYLHGCPLLNGIWPAADAVSQTTRRPC